MKKRQVLVNIHIMIRRGEVFPVTATGLMTSVMEQVTFIPKPLLPLEISNS